MLDGEASRLANHTDGGSALPATPKPPIPARLSPAALTRYRICPRSFWLFDAAKRRNPFAPTPALAQGNAVHAALERFFGLPPDKRTEAVLGNVLRAVWRRHVQPDLFSDRTDEAACGQDALRMLSEFHRHYDTKAIPLAREQWVATRLPNGVDLVGRVDRLDTLAGGPGTQVIDYKTGWNTVDPLDLADEPAAQIYALGSETLTRRPIERVRLLYLRSGAESRWEPEREDIDTTRDRLTTLTDAIRRDRAFEAVPGPHCSWCPASSACGRNRNAAITGGRREMADAEVGR